MEELSTKYKLKSATILCSEYNQFLYKLYLPLIGQKAVFLYEFLMNEYSYGNRKFTLKEVVKRSGLNLQDFLSERTVLESINLLHTFQGEGQIILLINPILTPKNFFADDVLKGLFINEVGKKEAEDIMKHYVIDDDPEGLTEITSSINDNFVINFDFDNLSIGEGLKLLSTNKTEKTDSFDDVMFFAVLTKRTNIKETAISPDELKKVHNVGVLFGLDEKIMAQIVTDSFDMFRPFGEKIDMENLQRRAKSEVIASKSYNKKHKKVIEQTISGDSSYAQKVRYYQSMNPREFLKSKQDGVEPVGADLDIITYLSENMEFSFGVINVILDYTLQNTNNQLNRKYIEKVAASLKRNKVQTVTDCIDKLFAEKTKEAKPVIKEENNGTIDVDKVDISQLEDIDLDDLI